MTIVAAVLLAIVVFIIPAILGNLPWEWAYDSLDRFDYQHYWKGHCRRFDRYYCYDTWIFCDYNSYLCSHISYDFQNPFASIQTLYEKSRPYFAFGYCHYCIRLTLDAPNTGGVVDGQIRYVREVARPPSYHSEDESIDPLERRK